MISVIVCSRLDPSNDIHRRNVAATLTVPHEYIRIDNRTNRYGICEAYNEGVYQSNGDILVFVHEDVFFMEPGWGNALESKFKDQSIGLVGVAGTQYLFANPPGWVVAGRPFIKGRVVHELDNGNTYNLTVFSWEKQDCDVVAVDGLFFAIRKDLFNRIRFDDSTFDGFHFYDLDICMQVRKTHRLIVTWDILVKHLSGGAFNEIWKQYALRFFQKYRSELPATCTQAVPDLTKRISFENYDLRGKAPRVIIC